MGISNGGGGGGGGSGDLFLKWNGKDTSQFEGSPAHLPAGWTSPSLSVVADADAPSGSVLRLTVTMDSSLNTLVWLLNATPPYPAQSAIDENRSLEMDMDITIGGGGGRLAGFAFLGDDTDGGGYHGFQMSTAAPNGSSSRLEQGTHTRVISTFGTTIAAHRYRASVIAGKRAGVAPNWIVTWEGVAVAGRFIGGREDQIPYAAPGASWNDLACDRVGIAINAADTGTFDFDFRALSFKVLREAA